MTDGSLVDAIVAAGERSLADEAQITAELLQDVGAFVRRYVVLSTKQGDVIALWILHTYAMKATEATAFLAVTSAEKLSGKTRLLEVLELIVREPIRAVSASEAALFRAIEEFEPTLLFDEVDTIFGTNSQEYEPLRRILNAGNRRGAYALRTVGEGKNMRVGKFKVFGPKVLAGIGKLPDTVASRSIPIRLERKKRRESVDRFRHRQASAIARGITERLKSWSDVSVTLLASSEPALPDELDDRAQEGAEPLLAIADLAGGPWPDRARRALVHLCISDVDPEDETEGTRLLRACWAVMKGTEAIRSEDLVQGLNALENSPIGMLSKKSLAGDLRKYRIRAKKIRFGEKTYQGYHRSFFTDAWERYAFPAGLPSLPETASDPEQVEQSKNGGGPLLPYDLEQSPRVPEGASSKSPITMGLVPDVPHRRPSPEGADDATEEVRF